MRFITLQILKDAYMKKYAIPAFNINGFDWITVILKVAKEEKSPVIVASSDRLADYLGGFKTIRKLVEVAYERAETDIPVVLHLDHGCKVERCIEAIDAGYTSVMIDASKEPIDKNIELTRRVVEYAKKYGVTVEAEVGTVGGNEDGLIGGISYAKTDECVRMVQETGIDALAAALGSVHGMYTGEPNLSFERMSEIKDAIDVPLVLHGASGIPDYQIKKSIALGHAKININTDCNQVWLAGLRKSLEENKKSHEPRLVLEPAQACIETLVREKIRQFGSNNRV